MSKSFGSFLIVAVFVLIVMLTPLGDFPVVVTANPALDARQVQGLFNRYGISHDMSHEYYPHNAWVYITAKDPVLPPDTAQSKLVRLRSSLVANGKRQPGTGPDVEWWDVQAARLTGKAKEGVDEPAIRRLLDSEPTIAEYTVSIRRETFPIYTTVPFLKVITGMPQRLSKDRDIVSVSLTPVPVFAILFPNVLGGWLSHKSFDPSLQLPRPYPSGAVQ